MVTRKLDGSERLQNERARELLLAGDVATDRSARLALYAKAAATAEDAALRALATRKKATLAAALAMEGVRDHASERDLLDAGRELEAVGALADAARVYRAAEDVEGEARVLAALGDVDGLDDLLSRQSDAEREARSKRAAYSEIAMHLASGERRAALAMLEALASTGDANARARSVELAARRVCGAFARLVVGDRAMCLAIGSEIVVGRTEGITIPSHAMSRKHAAIARRADGAIVLRDLGSRNGTTLGRTRARVSGEIPIGDGLEVMLGGEVPMRVAPSAEVEGAAAIDVGGVRYVAPLGVARVGVGSWRLEVAPDDWIELVARDAEPVYAGELQLVTRVTLLAGDAFSLARGGPVVLRVLQSEGR